MLTSQPSEVGFTLGLKNLAILYSDAVRFVKSLAWMCKTFDAVFQRFQLFSILAIVHLARKISTLKPSFKSS